MQLLQYCNITVLWIHGLNFVLLVQGRGEMADLTAVTAVPLHQSAMDIWTEGRVVSTVQRGTGGFLCSCCNTVTLV